MLIKFFKKKITESIIDEAIKAIPELKEKAFEWLKTNKEEILKQVFEHIKEAVIDYFKKHLGK